jgi:hypothetical protein
MPLGKFWYSFRGMKGGTNAGKERAMKPRCKLRRETVPKLTKGYYAGELGSLKI